MGATGASPQHRVVPRCPWTSAVGVERAECCAVVVVVEVRVVRVRFVLVPRQLLDDDSASETQSIMRECRLLHERWIR